MDKVDDQVLATLASVDQTSGGLLSVLIAERTMATGFQLPCYPDASSFLTPIRHPAIDLDQRDVLEPSSVSFLKREPEAFDAEAQDRLRFARERQPSTVG